MGTDFLSGNQYLTASSPDGFPLKSVDSQVSSAFGRLVPDFRSKYEKFNNKEKGWKLNKSLRFEVDGFLILFDETFYKLEKK